MSTINCQQLSTSLVNFSGGTVAGRSTAVTAPAVAAVAHTTVVVLPVYLVGGLSVQVRAEFGLELATVGVLVGVHFFTAALSSVSLGHFADTLGAARLMRASSALAAIAMAAIALAPSTALLVVALAASGVANGVGQPAANAHISTVTPEHRKGIVYGIKQAAVPLALFMSGAAVPTFGVGPGWRWAFATGAALALCIAAFPLAATRRGDTDTPDGVETGVLPIGGRSRGVAAGDFHLGPLLLLALGVTLASAVSNTFGAYYVETAVASGTTPSTAGTYAAIASGCGIVVRLAIGLLADRFFVAYLKIVSTMIGAGALAALILARGESAWMLAAIIVAYALGWGWAGLFNFAVTLMHPRDPGRSTGITQGGIATGGLLGPIAFGQLAAASSLSSAWGVFTALSAVGAVLVLLARSRLVRHRPLLAETLRRGPFLPFRARARRRRGRA